MNINILHEDNHLLIVEKPVNLPVQKDRSKDKDLLTILKEDIKLRYNKPGNVFLAIVHRLDRPVGGAIVFSKTSKGASRLANELRKRKLKRSYLAIVRGQVQQREGQLVDYLYKDRRRNIVHVVDKNKKGCQKAILNYHVIDYFKNEFTLLYVTLQTGRSHQIRVQLAHMGYPLYGDQKYGRHVNKAGEQIALWSYQLSFKHPTKNEIVEVMSHPPNTYPWNIFID